MGRIDRIPEEAAVRLGHPGRDRMHFLVRLGGQLHRPAPAVFDDLDPASAARDWPARLPSLVTLCGRAACTDDLLPTYGEPSCPVCGEWRA